jgi:hypothetical protein
VHICAEAPHNVNDQQSKTPQMYLGSVASTMSHLGGNAVYRSGLKSEQLLVIPSETARWMADLGWSKSDVKRVYAANAISAPSRMTRASPSALPISLISASCSLTSGGRTAAHGMRPRSTSASFIRLCMSMNGSA